MVVVDWIRFPLVEMLHRFPRPFSGYARAAYHLDGLLVFSWYFLFLASCIHYFTPRRPWVAFSAWAVAWAITLNQAVVSGEVLGWIYRLVSLGCLVASWGCIAWGILRVAKLRPGLAHLVLILYASADVVINLIPYARGFSSQWPFVRFVNVLLLVTCVAAHVIWLRRRVPAVQDVQDQAA